MLNRFQGWRERGWVPVEAEVYAQALDAADRLVLTEIDADFEGDNHFPPFRELGWAEVARETHHAAPPNDFDYAFVTYHRQR